jgi:hypothetical protein
MSIRTGGLVALCLALGAVPLVAGEEAKAGNELTLVTQRVVVFKDGYALVVKEGAAVSDEKGVVFTREVPDAAVLGTFWAVPAEGRLLAMDAGVETVKRKEEKTSKVGATGYADLLAMNVGKQARIVLDDNSVVIAPVRAVLGGSLVVLKTETGDLTLPVARIRSLAMDGLAIETDVTKTEEKDAAVKTLAFRFEGGAAPRKLTLLYFRPGIRWIPTYRIELPPEEGFGDPLARVALQAEILNEAEDFADAAVDLVVGVPNFRFKEVVSPFSLERTLRNALAEAAPQLMGQMMSNAQFSSRDGERRGEYVDPEAPAMPPELVAGGSQDLFLYSVPALSLAKGHRAALPIFDARVPLRHVYTWEVAVGRSDVLLAPSGKGAVSPLAITPEEIWHQVDLENRTGFPLTTGAAFLFSGGRPVAQELLTYTPVGGTVRVPLTVAVDVRGAYDAKELARKMDALNFDGYKYAEIEEEGLLTVRSYKAVPVALEARLSVAGRVTEAIDGGEVKIGLFRAEDWKHYRGSPAVNNSSDVLFRIPLGVGESAERRLRTTYYVRH